MDRIKLTAATLASRLQRSDSPVVGLYRASDGRNSHLIDLIGGAQSPPPTVPLPAIEARPGR